MQLRNFGTGAGADGVLADAGEVAFFSEPKAEAPALAPSDEIDTDPVTASICDMLHSGDERYYPGRLVVTMSSLLMPALCCKEADAHLFSLPRYLTLPEQDAPRPLCLALDPDSPMTVGVRMLHTQIYTVYSAELHGIIQTLTMAIIRQPELHTGKIIIDTDIQLSIQAMGDRGKRSGQIHVIQAVQRIVSSARDRREKTPRQSLLSYGQDTCIKPVSAGLFKGHYRHHQHSSSLQQ